MLRRGNEEDWQARAEAAEAARQARAEAFQQRTEDLRVRTRGTALELRRRLRPVFRPFAAPLGRIAPVVSGALLFLIRLPAALIALVLEVTQVVLGWIGPRLSRATGGTARWVSTHVTRLSTLATVAAVAAVAMGVAQFFDFAAVIAGAPDYAGEVGTVADAPRTDVQVAGDAHLYLLLPVAVAALVLIAATVRGNWRLGRWIGILGLIGVAVSLAVDLPQGLDAGRAGPAFSGSQSELIEGFWAQLTASAVLAICGWALGTEVRRRRESGEVVEPEVDRPRRRAIWRRRPRPATDRGGLAGGAKL